LGEFYTPPSLAKFMVDSSYIPKNFVLDPACGSGTFIIEVIRKILSNKNLELEEQCVAISNLYGFDVNPIAIIATKTNIILILQEFVRKNGNISINLSISDFLFPSIGSKILDLQNSMDLIIGNPPWLVLKDIYNSDYKNKVKKLAQTYHIKPEAHQIPNLEISALFLYHAKKYLKSGGKVFYIVSNAVASGNNHAGTRQFLEFSNIRLWKFTKDVFTIHNICISARFKSDLVRTLSELSEIQVETKTFDPHFDNAGILTFQLFTKEIYTPYSVLKKNGNMLVKKLISQSEKRHLGELLPLGPNYYHDKCFNGASLYPRNLLFVKTDCKQGNLMRITPLIENPKGRWAFNPIEELLKMGLIESTEILLEPEFIYPVLKSIMIIPFLALDTQSIVLPLDITDDKGYKLTNKKKSKTWEYFQGLDAVYKEKIKDGASHNHLFKHIDYQHKLTTSRQRKSLKIVSMASGTLAKACLIRDPCTIIDTTCYYIGLDEEDEAYFLLGYLNSPVLTKSIQFIQAEGAGGSGRHIHKRPFDFTLPQFDSKNISHQRVVKIARKLEQKVSNLVKKRNSDIRKEKLNKLNKSTKSNQNVISPRKIQNQIYKELGWNTSQMIITGDFATLNEAVIKVIQLFK
jgi:methylase of polypeptide subunit release factors